MMQIFFLVIILFLFLLYICYKYNNDNSDDYYIEDDYYDDYYGSDDSDEDHIIIRETMLDQFSKGQQVNDLKSMRDFLEGAYSIAISNQNVVETNNIKPSVCYQISVLGNYIPPILGGIVNQSIEDLFKLYGPPTPQPYGVTTAPQQIPILTSSQDYITLLQLYIASKNLTIFSSGIFPLWKSDSIIDSSGVEKVVKTDLCFKQTTTNTNIITYAKNLYSIVTNSLEHFHNQITHPSTITSGDIADTKSYSEGMENYYSEYMLSACIAGKTTICNENPNPSEFYSYYKSITYTDFPNAGTYYLRSYMPSDTTKFRVLLIGGSGGGGGAASGKSNNRGHDSTGGGGGGGGGGGTSLSGIYPYSNNYTFTVGEAGRGGSLVYGQKHGTPGIPGNAGNSSYLYDTANSQTILSANGGGPGGGGFIGMNQGAGGYGGTGITNNGNSGGGSGVEKNEGASPGSSVEWSSPNDTVIAPLKGGTGGSCPYVGRNNGRNTAGNPGTNGNNGFVRVYWIP
jgi:hypothetical protein